MQSLPNKQLGVPVAKQAEFDAIAERIAYDNPRVAAFSQYLLKDDPLGGAPGASVARRHGRLPDGLEYANGTPKPLYCGWPLPLTVTKPQPRRLAVGPRAPGERRDQGDRARAAQGLQELPHAEDRRRRTASATGASAPPRRAYWRVRWTSPQGVKYEGPPIGLSAS